MCVMPCQVLDGVLSWLSGGECGEVLHVGGPEDLYLKGPEMACAVLQDLLQVIYIYNIYRVYIENIYNIYMYIYTSFYLYLFI
jgi:hypothetical protein